AYIFVGRTHVCLTQQQEGRGPAMRRQAIALRTQLVNRRSRRTARQLLLRMNDRLPDITAIWAMKQWQHALDLGGLTGRERERGVIDVSTYRTRLRQIADRLLHRRKSSFGRRGIEPNGR